MFVGNRENIGSSFAKSFTLRHNVLLSTVFSLHGELDAEVAKGCPIEGMRTGSIVEG